jgi:hypothetical protein
MERMGHSSTKAALIYLHVGEALQRTIAEAVNVLSRAALQSESDRP